MDLTTSLVKTKSGRWVVDQCTLVVPENRSHPSSRLINLPIQRYRATGGHSSEPVFYLGGGPGASNLKFQPPADLLADHDVVLVGYRGVDGSASLDCPEVSRALTGRSGNLLGVESQRAIGGAIQAGVLRLQSEGYDLSGYTIAEVIADLEAARQALGYERINLLSQSYGTRVALFYAQKHPEHIQRSVMIGVNPPGRFVWESRKIDEQLRYYDSLFAARQEYRDESPGLVESMQGVNRSMPFRWIFIPIDPGKVKASSFALLFHRKTAALVFDAYLSAARGDPSGLALLSLASDFVVPKAFNWGDFMAKGFSADYQPERNYNELGNSGTIMGSPLAQLFWHHAALWPTPLLPDAYRCLSRSNVETLLISGSVDFSTPAEYATREVLPYLERGQQVILSEMGHTGDLWGVQPKAMIHLISTFLHSGEVDRSQFAYQPMDFHTGWMSLPRLAKILAGGLILAVLGVLGGIIALVRGALN